MRSNLTIFILRPETRNIGNSVISLALSNLLLKVFGTNAVFVNIPAQVGRLGGIEFGGLSPRQVYDINRLADGLVIGGGNLFENGQLSCDIQALSALRVPTAVVGLSHGKIYDDRGELVDRTDSLQREVIMSLIEKSEICLVRDGGTFEMLRGEMKRKIKLGGCPALFLDTPRPSAMPALQSNEVLMSLRHPMRMSVPPRLQWRVVEDVRRIIHMVQKTDRPVRLLCHDYADLDFAAAFTDVPTCYFDDVKDYIDTLTRAPLCITYRLHAFLPCLALGTPCIHISYDGRGKDMVATAGMNEWDVNMVKSTDVVAEIQDRMSAIELYNRLRQQAVVGHQQLLKVTMAELENFKSAVLSRVERKH